MCCCQIFTVFFVRIIWIGSIGQLHLDSSISALRYLAARTNFIDSPFAKMITGFMNVLPFGCSYSLLEK